MNPLAKGVVTYSACGGPLTPTGFKMPIMTIAATIPNRIGVKILPKRSTILFGVNASHAVMPKNRSVNIANVTFLYEAETNGEAAISNATVAVRGIPKRGPIDK